MTVRPSIRNNETDGTALDRRGTPNLLLATCVAALLRSWHVVLGLPLVTAAVTAFVVLVITPRYESTFTLVPASSAASQASQLGNLSIGGGLAAIAQGLGFGSILGSGTPLEYFSDLAFSRRVAERVLTHRLPPGIVPGDSTVHTLLDVFALNTGESRKDMDLAYRTYQDHVLRVTTDPQSGILTATVSARSPDLALTIAHMILD